MVKRRRFARAGSLRESQPVALRMSSVDRVAHRSCTSSDQPRHAFPEIRHAGLH